MKRGGRVRVLRQIGQAGVLLVVDHIRFELSEQDLAQLGTDVLRCLETRRPAAGEEESCRS